MKKKIIALCLVVVLAVTAVTGATLAYFTDAENDKNTMLIGNVDVNIDELTYDSETGAWAKFEDDKFVLFPLPDDQGSVLYNKMVYVANDSDNYNAYMRAIVLVECPLVEGENGATVKHDHITFHYGNNDTEKQHGAVRTQHIENVNIDGVNYDAYVFECADKQFFTPGQYLNPMSSVWMNENTTQDEAATYGEKVDILILAQAIQTEGLTYDEAMNQLGGELTAEEIVGIYEASEDAEINDFFNYN